MPQIFFPPASRSLGHLMLASTPSSQSAFATATVWVMREARLATNPGRSTRDIQSPPFGDPHGRPSRPRPPVWTSATTRVPWGVPAWASSRARSWVEPSASCTSTTRASGLFTDSMAPRFRGSTNAYLLDRRHLLERPGRRLHERHGEQASCPLAKPHVQLEERTEVKRSEGDARSRLGGAMARDDVSCRVRSESTGDERSGVRDYAVEDDGEAVDGAG